MRFTARVPGIGFVDWSSEHIDGYARMVGRTHLIRRSIAWRGRWVFRWPSYAYRCRHCAEPWPCPPAWWASRYRSSVAETLAEHTP